MCRSRARHGAMRRPVTAIAGLSCINASNHRQQQSRKRGALPQKCGVFAKIMHNLKNVTDLGFNSGPRRQGFLDRGSVRESYLLALCLTLAGALAAICLLFVRRERVLRHRLTRDRATGVLASGNCSARAPGWSRPRAMPAAALFLVRFEQYAEISAMLRAGEDKALLALVAQRLTPVARALGGIVGRCGLDTFTVCVPDVDEQGAAQVSQAARGPGRVLRTGRPSADRGVPRGRGAVSRTWPHGRGTAALRAGVHGAAEGARGPGLEHVRFPPAGAAAGPAGLENDLRLALTAEHGAVRAVLPARLRQRLRHGRGMRGAAALASSRAGQRLAGRDHRAGRAQRPDRAVGRMDPGAGVFPGHPVAGRGACT